MFEHLTEHDFDALHDLVLVVAFEQLITGMEDIEDLICILDRVTQPVLVSVFGVFDDACFVHQQVEVNVDVVDAEVKGIPPEIVEAVYIYSRLFVTHDFVLPDILRVLWWLANNQTLNSLDTSRGEDILEFFPLGHMIYDPKASKLVTPLGLFLWSSTILLRRTCLCFSFTLLLIAHELVVKHMTKRTMADVVKQPCKRDLKLRFPRCVCLWVAFWIVCYQLAHILLAEVGSSNTMLKSRVHC